MLAVRRGLRSLRPGPRPILSASLRRPRSPLPRRGQPRNRGRGFGGDERGGGPPRDSPTLFQDQGQTWRRPNRSG
eukprot:4781957-Lingulodinium_polyedra.AAC.1